MSNNSFWQNLPEHLSQPTSVAIITSVGLHAVILGALPLIAWSDTQENTQRLVSLIDLPPSRQNQLYQSQQIPPLPSLPNSSEGAPNEDEVPLAALPAPPPITTNFNPSSNPFRFPNLPSVDGATGSVTLPPLTLPDFPPLPEPPPLELPSSVVTLPPQPPSLAQESVPPRLVNPPQTLPAPTSPPDFRVTQNPNPGNTPREIPDLSQFSASPQIPSDFQATYPPEFQATYPPDAAPVPPPPTTRNAPAVTPAAPNAIATAPGDTSREIPSPAEQLRGIEASIDNPPSLDGRSIPEIPSEFVESEERLLADEPEATPSPSTVAANPAPPSSAAPPEPVLSQQRAELVAELKERRQMLVADPSNTTPAEANRNWLTWVEAVQDVDPEKKSLTTAYPQDACLKELEGTTVYGVLVNPDGAIADIELIKSSGYGVFNQKARDAINQHNFGSLAESTPFQVTVSFDYDTETCPSLTVSSPTPSSEQAANPASSPPPQPQNTPAAPPQPEVGPNPAPSPVQVEVVPPAEIANPVPAPAAPQPAAPPQPEPPQSPVEIEVVPPAEVIMPADSPEFYQGE